MNENSEIFERERFAVPVLALKEMARLLRIAAMIGMCWGLSAAAQQEVVLVGSGSNLPIRLYQAWAKQFNTGNAHIKVQYMALGSSEGLRQISSGSGDFAAGEIPLTDKNAHGVSISLLAIPTVLVGIVPIYNLPGKPKLNFSGQVLARIYLGAVKNWNDPRLAKLNPGIDLPDLPIRVVHRSAGKGSNFIFTDYLSKTDAEFRAELGRSPSPNWPVGVEVDRGQDMVRKVASIPGAIGYVEMSFVRNSGVSYGRVENAWGQFVEATPANVEAACAEVKIAGSDDFSVSMTNAPGKFAYPITSFTWIYVPTSGIPLDRRHALKEFLMWSLQDGQKLASTIGYVPLPERIASQAMAAVDALP